MKTKKRKDYIPNGMSWIVLILSIITVYIIWKVSENVFLNNLVVVLIVGLVVYLVIIFFMEIFRDVVFGAD